MGAKMPEGRKLTPKQLAFADHYLSCGNSAEAVRLAGYQTKYPGKIGYQLLENPRIADFITAHAQKERKLRILNAEERQHILSSIAADKKNLNVDRIRAIDTLNKMFGEYLNRTELTGSLTVPMIIDDIPKDI
jgi:phage terminase small subunit